MTNAGTRRCQYIFGLLLFVVFAALAVYYPNVGDDYDVWWHLRYGEYFIRNLTWRPDHSIFSWTPADADWRYVSWLGDIILYAAYRIGGDALLNGLQWMLFLAAAGIMGLSLRCYGRKFCVTHLAVLFCVGVAINPVAAYIKPELFTILFFTFAVFIYTDSKCANRDRFYWYPLLFLIWANTHGGFINGFLFIGTIWFFEGVAIQMRLPTAISKRQWRRLTVAIVFSAGAVCVNPYGIWYPWGIITTLWNGLLGISHVQAVTAYTSLWPYLFQWRTVFRLVNTAWILMFMGAFAAVRLVLLYQKKRFFDLALTLAMVVFFVFSFSMARAGIYFALLWPFALLRIDQADEWLCSRGARFTAGCLIVLMSGLIFYQVATINTYDSWFGNRIENWSPVNETVAIRKYKMPAPIFNDYLSGGYLVWALFPDYKVFIDPRYGPYETTGVWDEYMELHRSRDLSRAWDCLDSKYCFNTVILHVEQNFRLIDTILASPDWQLVYFDRVAVVFVRTKLAGEIGNACRQDMSPEKFANISNPDILFRAFYLYCNYNMSAATRIREIYDQNVRKWHRTRTYHLRRMEEIIKSFQ